MVEIVGNSDGKHQKKYFYSKPTRNVNKKQLVKRSVYKILQVVGLFRQLIILRVLGTDCGV